jgi:hypothetical protein
MDVLSVIYALLITTILFTISKTALPKLNAKFWDLWRIGEAEAPYKWWFWGVMCTFSTLLFIDANFGFIGSIRPLDGVAMFALSLPFLFLVIDIYHKAYTVNYIIQHSEN